jgi:dTDP-D-glucose 4,6-dehydratase
MNILITGGMGFIGSNFIGHIIGKEELEIFLMWIVLVGKVQQPTETM